MFSRVRRKLLKLFKEFTMQAQRLIGTRIREKRLDRGLQQGFVAKSVGISPSYLNLIEHNRRRIGGRLLTDIARILQVAPAFLTDGADADILDGMHTAAGAMPDRVELARAEELAARYPGWAGLIVTQARQIADLQDQIRRLADRMAYDPQLSGALHAVISAVTAIRSSASILVGPEALDDDWQRRFHENIHTDSLRLAASSEALIAYLDAPEAQQGHFATPHQAVAAYLADAQFHLSVLEQGDSDIAALVAAAGLPGTAAALLQARLECYAADAQALPLAAFQQACRNLSYDPLALAGQFDAPLPRVLRRLACLPPGQGHPLIGLIQCDASGALQFVKPVPGFVVQQSGALCPLWPLFSALQCPGQVIRRNLTLATPDQTTWTSYAFATAQQTADYDHPPVIDSLMLVMPGQHAAARPTIKVGMSCRTCPRSTCTARREPAITGGAKASGL